MQEHGFEIIAHNWRTRWCEIDIIARRHDIIHIVEVKYRARTNYGTAAEFVTYGKQERLIRAAASWVQQHRYNGPYQIDVVTVEGALDAPRHYAS